ncbi:hypothetical protein [Flammeovirga pacifica]|uniref:Glycoside hydrolase family 5 domain-containing protein n=1 Tax=Flammeovirga pacifica TaxID=915059 RepID=A0A1S1Z2X2_FLAPC|nr:hypothetical protein [Flammeovirga pacifica]OHX67577.1 hypothetical protein NH26_15080 [Flammeovirga pacifica]
MTLKRLLLFLLSFSIIVCLTTCKKGEPTFRLIFNKKNKINHDFKGFGIQWSTYQHADAPGDSWGHLMKDTSRWNLMFKRLKHMKPSIIRIIDDAEDRYFRGINSEGSPIVNYNRHEMHALYKILDFCQRNNIQVILGEWNPPWQMLNGKEHLWTEMIADYMNHLVKVKRYSCIKYFTLVNAPNTFKAKTQGSYAVWKDWIMDLEIEFSKYHLNHYIKIMGPSSDPTWDMPLKPLKGKDWLSKSNQDLKEVLGAYDVHAFLDEKAVRKGDTEDFLHLDPNQIQNLNGPLFISELGIKAEGQLINDGRSSRFSQPKVFDKEYAELTTLACMDLLQLGVDGIIAWYLDDAMFTEANDGNKSQIMRWGMWNSLGDTLYHDKKELNIRPWYYTWSLMSKNIPKGSTIVRISNNNHQKINAVGVVNTNNEYVILLSNSTSSEQIVEINFSEDLNNEVFTCVQLNHKESSEKNSIILPKNDDIEMVNDRSLLVKLSNKEMKLITSEELKYPTN